MGIVNSTSTYAGFPVGLEVAKCDVILQIHATVAAGDLVAIDPATVSADYRFTKTAAIASASTGGEEVDQVDGGFFAVALEDKTLGTTATYAKFRVQGVVEAQADGTVGVGDLCSANAGGDGFIAGAIGSKIVAVALEAGSDNNKSRFMIDGLNGFGTRTV